MIIYGVDTNKNFSAKDVRDAIIECFTLAHKKELENSLRDASLNISEAEFENMKKININQMIRNYFSETDGDFDNPNKESILKVMDKCVNFSKNFRDDKIIQKHYRQINQLVSKLK